MRSDSGHIRRAPVAAVFLTAATLVLGACSATNGVRPGSDRAGATLRPAAMNVSPAVEGVALMGRAPEGVVAVLGQPHFRRLEGRALLWQYRADNCVLDVVFFDGVVVHTEVRRRRTDTDLMPVVLTSDGCLAVLSLPMPAAGV